MDILLPGISDENSPTYFLALSLILPYFIAIFQQNSWSTAVRNRVTFGFCAVCAALILVCEHQFSPQDFLGSTALLFVLTGTIYRYFARAAGAATLESITTRIFEAWTRRQTKTKNLNPNPGGNSDESLNGF